MKLKRVKASKVNKVLRCSVHKTGKLGFTRDAAEYLQLKSGYSVQILTNDDDPKDLNLYVKVFENQDDIDNFKVSKAGDYYYVNLKSFYELHNIDYIKNDVSYDIRLEEIENEDYFVFKRRSSETEEEEDEEEVKDIDT